MTRRRHRRRRVRTCIEATLQEKLDDIIIMDRSKVAKEDLRTDDRTDGKRGISTPAKGMGGRGGTSSTTEVPRTRDDVCTAWILAFHTMRTVLGRAVEQRDEAPTPRPGVLILVAYRLETTVSCCCSCSLLQRKTTTTTRRFESKPRRIAQRNSIFRRCCRNNSGGSSALAMSTPANNCSLIINAP
jgi:hypothetical protein